jgi:hypothetical protein
MEYLMLILIGGIISGMIGLFIGDLGNKNNSKSGALLGFFLGPIGWIITAVLPPTLSDEEKGKLTEAHELERRKIALLEAQLAELKKNQTKGQHLNKSTKSDENPPVYRLD